MAESVVHPALVLIVGALLLPMLRGTVRSPVIVLVPLLALALVWQIPDGPVWQAHFLEHTITPLQGDKLSRLFATIFALMAVGGGLFALRQERRLEVPAAFLYAGSAIGVALAGDLISVFVLLGADGRGLHAGDLEPERRGVVPCGTRYMMIHLLGGVVLFAGIAGHVVANGSVAFTHAARFAGALVDPGRLPGQRRRPAAVGLAAGCVPGGSWSGTVFLSAFTTKTAVYVLIRGFPGTELLIWVGLFMAFYGIVYALLENDMRRILAYSIVNQVGFMIAGIGIGTEMALNGAAAHAFTHIIYKALLLMSAGSVLLMTGRRKCSELGGLFHTMPLTTALRHDRRAVDLLVPAHVRVRLEVDGVAGGGRRSTWLTVWLLLTAASAGVFLHAGIKFPWFVFFQKDSGLRPAEPPRNMRWAMVLFSALCIGLGICARAAVRAAALSGGLRALYVGARGRLSCSSCCFRGSRSS